MFLTGIWVVFSTSHGLDVAFQRSDFHSPSDQISSSGVWGLSRSGLGAIYFAWVETLLSGCLISNSVLLCNKRVENGRVLHSVTGSHTGQSVSGVFAQFVSLLQVV